MKNESNPGREFDKIYNELMESMSVGRVMGSAPGDGTNTSTQFSGDNYAPGDTRTPKVIGSKKKKRDRRKKVKKNKKDDTPEEFEEEFPIIRRPKITGL